MIPSCAVVVKKKYRERIIALEKNMPSYWYRAIFAFDYGIEQVGFQGKYSLFEAKFHEICS